MGSLLPRPLVLPKFTVLYNIVSKNSNWVGTAWEFFNTEEDAQVCYQLQIERGNCPCVRPYNHDVDFKHLGAAHHM